MATTEGFNKAAIMFTSFSLLCHENENWSQDRGYVDLSDRKRMRLESITQRDERFSLTISDIEIITGRTVLAITFTDY